MKLPVNYNDTHYTVRKKVREEYARRQGGKCAHCNEPLVGPPSIIVGEKVVNPDLFPSGFFKWPVHLHHNRKTGMTIDAIHNHCNKSE